MEGIDLAHSLLHAILDRDQNPQGGLAVGLVPFHLQSDILEIIDLGLQQGLAIILGMTMTSGPIEMLVIDLEGDYLMSHVIIVCPTQEDIRVGVLVLEKGSRIGIVLNHQNIVVIGVQTGAQDHQDIAVEVELPLEAMMRKRQSTAIVLGLSLSRIDANLEKKRMKEKRMQGIAREGGLGQHLMRISTMKMVGCRHKVQMKRYQFDKSVRGRDLWTVSTGLR